MKTRTPSLPLSISFPDFAGMVVLFFPFFAGRQFTVNARWSRLGFVSASRSSMQAAKAHESGKTRRTDQRFTC
jgi:hypothetical protein